MSKEEDLRGIYQICSTGHGDCQKCLAADYYMRCYYCYENQRCRPFSSNGFMGPDRDCGIGSQRVGTCVLSLNAIFTPIFLICYALIGIGLIVVIVFSVRNYLRDKKQTARMVKTHHLNSPSGSITNSHLWEELNAEADDKQDLYSGYMIKSPATTVTSLRTPSGVGHATKPRNVRWMTADDIQQRRAAREKRGGNPGKRKYDEGEEGRKRGGDDREEEEDDDDRKPVGKAGITTSKRAKSEASVSFGSTPTPGASSECSLGSLAKTKSLLQARREFRARSPAVTRKSQWN